VHARDHVTNGSPKASLRAALASRGGLVVAALLVAAAASAVVYGGRVPSPRAVRIYEATGHAPTGVATDSSVRVLVAAMTSTGWTFDMYAGLVDWLGRRLGRPATLLQRRNYFEANEAIRRGDADVAFICTGAYVRALRDGGYAELLAVPVVGGATTYHSVLLVGASSPWKRLEDLRGRSVAFVDPLSLTGRLYVAHRAREIGADEAAFFSNITYTGSHDRSIEAVARGLVAAAPVDELVLRAALVRSPDLGAAVRVLERSPPFGIPPVVVPRQLPAETKRALAGAFLEMHESPTGRDVLLALGIDRFAPPSEDLYEAARLVVGAE